MQGFKLLFGGIVAVGAFCLYQYIGNGAGDVFGAVGGTCVLFGLLFLCRFSGE